MEENKSRKSFWTTLPGILTAIAAIITAVGGLIGTLYLIGVFETTPTPIVPSGTGTTPPSNTSNVAYPIHIEAEHFDEMSDPSSYGVYIQTDPDDPGTRCIGYISDDEWVRYYDVDFQFTSMQKFKARVASVYKGGTIEIKLDGISGQTIGICQVPNTNGWFNWTEVSCELNVGVQGKRTICLVFKGETVYLFNIDWIELLP